MPRLAPALFLLTTALVPAAEKNPLTCYAFGCLRELRGEAPAALESFQAARASAPGSLAPARRIAGLQHAMGELAAASTTLRDFAAAHPGNLAAQIHYAGFLTDSSPGDALALRLAIETLEQARPRSPGDPTLLRMLFHCYENAGRRADSLRLFESAADAAPGNAPLAATLATLGRRLFPADSAEGTRTLDTLHQHALDAAPADPTVARAASEHYRNTGRLDQAVAVLDRHCRAAPESLDLRVRLGILQFAADANDDGMTTLRAVLAIHPRKVLAHQALAKFFRRNQQPDEARHHAIRLLELRGGSAREFLELAGDLLDDAATRQARLLLEKALYHHPGHPGLAVQLAIASRRDPQTATSSSRRFREAENLLTASDPAATPDPAFLVEFAEALLAEGLSEPAEDRLREAIRRFPPDAAAETAAAMRRLAGLWTTSDRHPEAAKALLQRAEALER